MTNYYWNNCYRWSKSSWDKYNALPKDTKRALTEGGEKQLWLLKYEKQLGRLWPGLTEPPKSRQIDCKTGNPIDSDVDAVGNSDSSDLLNETPYPWEKWEQLPKEEREAEMSEAAKEAANKEFLEDLARKGITPIGFPALADVDAATETEAVGHHGGPHFTSPPDDQIDEPYYTDFITQRNAQKQEESATRGGGYGDGAALPAGSDHVLRYETPYLWERIIPDALTGGADGSDLDVNQADSITGESANTENVGGNVSWMDPRGPVVENEGNGYKDKSYDKLVTEFISDSETFSPLEFDVAVPLLTDQPVMGDQQHAVGSNVCEQLKGVVPKWDLPFGCN